MEWSGWFFSEKGVYTSYTLPAADIEEAVRAVINGLRLSGERELPSLRVGELVMAELKKLDQVAYVRFASVYRKFEDVQAFREEIERLERDLPGLEGLQLSLLEPGDKARQ